jgi:transcriptional regulator with XRE-family HTH domain
MSEQQEPPLIERMRETVRTQAPGAERAQPPPTDERTPRVARKGARRSERAARERRQISRAGEVVKDEQPVRPKTPEAQPARGGPERAGPDAGRAPTPGEQGEEREVADPALADHLAGLRNDRGWSLQDLAKRTGVSRSTLSRAERGEVSPTAAVLTRLATAYERPLSSMLAEVEPQPRSLVRSAEQTVTGADAWRRRAISPPYPGLNGSVVDATLLPGTDVTYEPPVTGAEQHLWLITGSLEVSVAGDESRPAGPAETPPEGGGEDLHALLHRHGIGGVDDVPDAAAALDRGSTVLIRGDCLRLRLWGPARLRCLSPEPARYAIFTVTPDRP